VEGVHFMQQGKLVICFFHSLDLSDSLHKSN
jgi:hypothetical protein